MASEDGYKDVTVAGLAIVSGDGLTVFLAQRSYDETDDPDVRETWEFPGGHLNKGEDPEAAAYREFNEEIGFAPPDMETINGWRSEDGHYQGFVCVAQDFPDISDWQPTKEVQAIGWFTPEAIEKITASGEIRPEVSKMDWSLVFGAVSGNQPEEGEQDMDDDTLLDEPTFTLADLAVGPIPIHGVMAPEEAESGDKRGFTAGSVTSRPYRLPFAWQKVSVSAHDGSVVTGSVDRLMRKDGLIHWEGLLMPNAEAGEFAEVLAFFGRFGVSIDGDKGALDAERSMESGVTWYNAVRAAGLTAVAIPAFAEAYVAFGPHPDMPEVDSDEFAVMTASGDMVTFDRGPGWATHPKETKRIHDYWTKKGQPGYAKIKWGTPGDFRRARVLIGEKIGLNSPEDLKYLNQIIAQWHFDALGYWPGELGKPGNAPDTPENRRRAATHAGLDEDLDEVRKEVEEVWETVLVSSGGTVARPPLDWFTRHPDTDATVIEDPDPVTGLRRTYGYAGEWGICHIAYDGTCQEVPMDPSGGTYPWFHLGRTKLDDGSYVNTGLITYGKAHRSREEILSETPTQAHFDDLRHAWAAVVIGEDERGVWFSGVVLPTVEEKWLVAIEASGQVSGEWKRGELRTLLTINVPGFPVARSEALYDEDGELLALTASAMTKPFKVCEVPSDAKCVWEGCQAAPTWGVWLSPQEPDFACEEHYVDLQNGHQCAEPEPTPAERIAALAQVDAEERIAAARLAFTDLEA
jgi:8-oxo-dGTP pyrophosphatase MutT (NUDIX family)